MTVLVSGINALDGALDNAGKVCYDGLSNTLPILPGSLTPRSIHPEKEVGVKPCPLPNNISIHHNSAQVGPMETIWVQVPHSKSYQFTQGIADITSCGQTC